MVHQQKATRRLIIDARADALDSLVEDITAMLARSGVAVHDVRAGDGDGDTDGVVMSAGPTVPRPIERPVVPGSLCVGDLVVSPDARTAQRAGGPLALTRIEFDLLVQFLRHVNRVLTKEALLDSVWRHEPVTPNAIEARISRLRAKLEKHGPRVIHTVRGVGYVLHALPDPPSAAGEAVIELVAGTDQVVLDTSHSLARRPS